VQKHEFKHIPETEPCDPCKADTYLGQPKNGIDRDKVECRHVRESKKCLEDGLKDSSETCKGKLMALIGELQKTLDDNCQGK
jgi:hypothetical protein